MTLAAAGYVDVGPLALYYERHGRGAPVVLLHGAMGTIESCFAALLPRLATHFEIVAVELQGHGHTRDIARPLSYAGMARDIAALTEELGLKRAHVVGYSMGGAVAVQLALDRPDLVDHVVFAGGAAFDASGMYPELLAAVETIDLTQLDGTAWHAAYRRVAPDPDAWTTLVHKVNQLDRSGEPSWSREALAALRAPTLLIIGDGDIVRPEHTVEMFRHLGGGMLVDVSQRPRAQLAVLPGTSHEGQLERIDWVASMILAFLPG